MLLCPILCVLLLFWIEFKMLVYEMLKQEYVEKNLLVQAGMKVLLK